MSLLPRTPEQNGFTLVELLVVAPIVILAIGAFLSAIIAMTGEVLASRASNTLSYNVQGALNRIEQDVKLSNGFLAENSVMGDNQGYDNDGVKFTNVAGASGTSLILRSVATNLDPTSINSTYVYLKDQPQDCSNPRYNTPLSYNIVYFIKDNTLFRRTLMPADYADTGIACSNSWQQPSCAPSYMNGPGQSGTTFCLTKDEQLVEGVTDQDFNIQYFNKQGTSAPNETASNSAVSTANRTIALKRITTVSVSVRAQQAVSGRDIERSALVRVALLDENTSGIAGSPTNDAPSKPAVSSRINESIKPVFAWPQVATATGYSLEYQINSGSWQVGFTNAATRSFTVAAATNKDTVKARVTAINSSGSSAFGTASETIPLWIPFSYENNWIDHSTTFASGAFTKTSGGVVVLKGMAKMGSGVLATLPDGYRPEQRIIISTRTGVIGNGRLEVYANGELNVHTGDSSWFSLDGVAFMPSGTSFTPLTAFSNGWSNYSSSGGTFRGASYATDALGRIHLEGLIKGGTNTMSTTMLTLPSAARPPEDIHVANVNGAPPVGEYRLNATGVLQARGYPNGYASLQTMYYTGARVSGSNCSTQWCAMSLQNSWANYPGPAYPTAQYTKSSDGLVMLKGLIRNGSSATAQIATLPAGYCPAERHLLTVATDGGAGAARLDVRRDSNGTCAILPLTGTNTGWVSLSTIRYMAEP